MLRKTVLLLLVGLGCCGCVVEQAPPPPPPPPPGPVVVAPGVEVIEVEPPPPDRIYIYDPGYPPGTYFYNGYYYYGGYCYPREVFVDRYVVENVRRGRYVDVEENRRMGRPIEVRHRDDFARTRGVRAARPGPPRQVRPEPGDRQHIRE